ncbi:hypothetical protein MLD38_028154 [Melastoma candidum]|uniref:Uncharacterized protein n=1 Tax=Melastoma candidum TaxID=119954 RepID=A0ACB9N2H9_9MYRT|nr:hypothetical protein MLD38_028154 [Melastoma candidum]
MGFEVPPYTFLELPRHPAGSRRMKKLCDHRKRPKRFTRRKAAPAGPRKVVTTSRRSSVTITRRVRTLKSLVPNGESMDLEGLFRETADYITCLEMRVRAMQMVVDALTCSGDR